MVMTREDRKERGVLWDISYSYNEDRSYCQDHVDFNTYDKTGRLRSHIVFDDDDVESMMEALKHYKQVKKNVTKNKE